MSLAKGAKNTWLSDVNVQLFSSFVTGHRFDVFQTTEKTIFVVGLKGAGKSAFQWIPLTNLASDQRYIWVDTVGLNGHRGDAYLKWTRWSLTSIFQLVQKVQGILVVLDINEAFASRGDSLRSLAKEVSALVGEHESSEAFYKSMIVIVNNVQGGRVNMSELETRLTSMKASEEEELAKSKYKLEALYGETWSKVPDEVKDALNAQKDTIRFLDACLTACAQKRCVGTYWPDAQACPDQRLALKRMVDALPGLTQEQVKQTCTERQTYDFEMACMLSKIISRGSPSLMEHLQKCLDCTETMIQVCNENQLVLEAIESGDWKVLHSNKVQEMENFERLLELKLTETRRTILRLETSSRLMPLSVHQIRESRSSGPLSWTIPGFGWAEKCFELEGSVEYEEYHLEGAHYTKMVLDHTPKSGILRLYLRSMGGHDLSVNVKILRQECHLPATLDRVSKLKLRVEKMEADLQRAKSRRSMIEATTDKGKFRDIIVSNLNRVRHEWADCERQLGQIVLRNMETGPEIATQHLFNAMSTLIPLLFGNELLSTDLATADADTLNEFYEKLRRFVANKRRIQQDPCIMKNTDIRFDSFVRVGARLESDAPTSCSAQLHDVVTRVRSQITQWLQSGAPLVQSLAVTCTTHGYATAGALMLASSHTIAKYPTTSSLLYMLALVLPCVGFRSLCVHV